ncbi:DUF5683 domain-containing protein [Moorella naiadis]|uniref:DUF5683 domain-containing protein n=1 Tax=Moorella naiadis (nom. illeg.) TaxID=3093670 RepID=UPI003D9C9F51
MKNPGVAAVLSFFIPGLGQIYNGELKKGFLLLAAAAVSVLLTAVAIGFLTDIIIWVYAIYDAYKTADNYNKRLAGQKPEENRQISG